MKGKRTDLETKALIIEGLINGKLGSDIAEEVGVHESTVSRIKDNDLQVVASESKVIASLVDRNDNLQSLADILIEELIRNKDAKVGELVQVKKVAWEQNQVAKGNPTDKSEMVVKWES